MHLIVFWVQCNFIIIFSRVFNCLGLDLRPPVGEIEAIHSKGKFRWPWHQLAPQTEQTRDFTQASLLSRLLGHTFMYYTFRKISHKILLALHNPCPHYSSHLTHACYIYRQSHASQFLSILTLINCTSTFGFCYVQLSKFHSLSYIQYTNSLLK
jgi:hypothetical protein